MMQARLVVALGLVVVITWRVSDAAAQVVVGAPSFRPASSKTTWSLLPDGPPVAVALTPPVTANSRLLAVIPAGAIRDGQSMTGLSCVVKDGSTSGEVAVRLYQIDPAAAKRTPTNLGGGQRLLAELRTGATDRVDTFSNVAATNVRDGLPSPYSAKYYYLLELSDSPGRPCNGDRLVCALHSCTIRLEVGPS